MNKFLILALTAAFHSNAAPNKTPAEVFAKSFVTAIQATYGETGDYCTPDIGFVPAGQTPAKIYRATEDIPTEYLTALPKEDLPFCSNNEFRAMMINKQGQKLEVWVVAQEIKKHYFVNLK